MKGGNCVRTLHTPSLDFAMADGIEEEEPGFAADESKGDFVCVKVRIPGLVPKTKGLFNRKTAEAKNATIEKPVFENKSFTLVIKGEKDSLKGKVFRLHIPLKYHIEPSYCYAESEENFVKVYLKKKDVEQSWEAEIRNGLVHTE